jgi:hypothetical protein
MPITINGSGTVTGISAGGLPDASVLTADIADANITAAKLSGAQTGSAPIYGCRAWVNFDGTRNEADTGASTNGANVKIRASGNVTSVLKNATGDYTVNFTTAMADANYSSCMTVVAGESASLNIGVGPRSTGYSTSSIRLLVEASNGVDADVSYVNVSIFC